MGTEMERTSVSGHYRHDDGPVVAEDWTLGLTTYRMMTTDGLDFEHGNTSPITREGLDVVRNNAGAMAGEGMTSELGHTSLRCTV